MKIEDIRRLPIGAWLVYCPVAGPREDGKLVSVGEHWVHVLYAGDTTAKATAPGDLELGCPSAYVGLLGLKLWVDDERTPPGDGWFWAKTSAEATTMLERRDVTEMSLDYSLGPMSGVDPEGDNGLRVMEWLRDHPSRWPDVIHAHSLSSSGRWVIERAAADWRPKESPDH